MTGKLQLLTEEIAPDNKPFLAEQEKDENGSPYYVLTGLCLEGMVQNHNGRVYPEDEISKAVEQLNQRISQRGPVPGELDHPEGLNINSDRISHLITKMWMEGHNGMGRLEIIDQGLGLIVGACIKRKMQMGVSSRGSGNIDHEGIVRDFDIVTIDIVANPSAQHAFPQASLVESLNNSKHGTEARYLSDCVRDDPHAQGYFEKEIDLFLVETRDIFTFDRGK